MSKKISVFMVILAFALVFSGCVGKDNKTSKGKDTAKDVVKENEIPAPTGKVDDTVDAIIGESSSEKEIVSGVDGVAKESISDSQETDDFVASYDENEF